MSRLLDHQVLLLVFDQINQAIADFGGIDVHIPQTVAFSAPALKGVQVGAARRGSFCRGPDAV
jgi:hypothetical protein